MEGQSDENSAMRLLINLLSYRPSETGLSRYAKLLLQCWEKKNIDHCLLQIKLSPEGKAILSKELCLPNSQQSRMARFLQENGLVQYATPVADLVSQAQPDIIYSPYTDYLFAARRYKQIITCHDLTPLYYPNSNRAYLRQLFLNSMHLKKAQHIVAISKSVANQLVDNGIRANQISIVPNYIKALGGCKVSECSRDMLVIARHAKNKNLELAVYGYSRFISQHPWWDGRLIIVGRHDRCTEKLMRQIGELALKNKVTFLSNVSNEELDALYERAFCLISTSLMEGFDYPLFEAQAKGLPTLASKIPVHEEFHEGVSLLFNVSDQGLSLAQQLSSLARDHVLWQQLSRLGAENARRYNSESHYKALNAVLRSQM